MGGLRLPDNHSSIEIQHLVCAFSRTEIPFSNHFIRLCDVTNSTWQWDTKYLPRGWFTICTVRDTNPLRRAKVPHAALDET